MRRTKPKIAVEVRPFPCYSGLVMSESKTVLKVEREVKKMDQILEKLKRIELQEFTNYLHSPWRILWANFLAGTARGLGFLLGAAFVITILGLITTKILGNIPVVGDFFQAINVWIQAVLQTNQK